MLINAIGTYSASQPLESMAITAATRGRRMYRSPSLTAASATRSPPGAIGMGRNAVSLRAGA